MTDIQTLHLNTKVLSIRYSNGKLHDKAVIVWIPVWYSSHGLNIKKFQPYQPFDTWQVWYWDPHFKQQIAENQLKNEDPLHWNHQPLINPSCPTRFACPLSPTPPPPSSWPWRTLSTTTTATTRSGPFVRRPPRKSRRKSAHTHTSASLRLSLPPPHRYSK